MNPLRCAIVGLGVGEQHAIAYSRDPRCVLVGLCDTDTSKRTEVGARFPGIPLYGSWQDLLANAEANVVSIASSDDAHTEQIVGSLNQGIHVFAEKPLCQTASELSAIRQAISTSQRALLTNVILRMAPAFASLKEMVQRGDLGTIYAFDGDYLYGRIHKILSGWRSSIPLYSVIQGGAVHLIDLMHWVLGERPESVRTHGNKIASRGTAFKFHDFTASTFLFPSGAIGRVTANFGCVHRHQHVVRVFGTEGTFISDALGPRVIRSRNGDVMLMGSKSALPDHKGNLIPDFLAAISQTPAERMPQVESHIQTTTLCLAADESLLSGADVKISYA